MNSWRWIGRSSALAMLILGAMSLSGQRAAAGESSGEPECEHATPAETKAFRGVVSDRSGAGIAGAVVVASCGSYRQTATTDSGGAYSLSLPPGKYRVRVTAEKFAPAEKEIAISSAEAAEEWTLTLSVATVQNYVLVTAEAGYAVTETTAGSKVEASLLDVPQAITVVDRELLNDQGAYKLDDVLKNVAGVMPGGYYEAWDYYRIRGFDASFNTYIDGLRER